MRILFVEGTLDKRKTDQFLSVSSSWLRTANDIGTAIREHKGYIHIPKLTEVDLVY